MLLVGGARDGGKTICVDIAFESVTFGDGCANRVE
jgi:hypothetical protein